MRDYRKLPDGGFVTSRFVRARYAFSNSTLHAWQNKGIFPKSVKIGPRAVRFRVEDLLEFERSVLEGGL